MKTENVPMNKNISYDIKDKGKAEPKEDETRHLEKAKEARTDLRPTKRIELEKSAINNPEAVQKLIGENIQWREMKFYQRQEGGQYYVDIVDKATGNVIRTIPDTKFGEVVEKYRQLSGLKINING
ncbi:MAG: flagellar protein FlaG [Proteobacteria bacterium]|nr:flagellar protein FlaG [Pseudomonadota bacterium]